MLRAVSAGCRRTLLALAAVASLAASRSGVPPAWEPDRDAPGAPRFAAGSWEVEHPAFRARLRPVSSAERLDYIRRRTGVEVDPFAARPAAEAVFVSWVLEVESRSSAVLSLEPGACLLVGPDRELRTPLDLASIEAAYGAADQPLPPVYGRVRPALLDGSVLLRPGDRAEGLLVYRVPRSLKRFQVEVSLTTAAGERVGFSAPHRLARRSRRGR